MPEARTLLVNMMDYCKTIRFRHKCSRLKALEVQGSWRSRRVAFEGILKLVSHDYGLHTTVAQWH